MIEFSEYQLAVLKASEQLYLSLGGSFWEQFETVNRLASKRTYLNPEQKEAVNKSLNKTNSIKEILK